MLVGFGWLSACPARAAFEKAHAPGWTWVLSRRRRGDHFACAGPKRTRKKCLAMSKESHVAPLSKPRARRVSVFAKCLRTLYLCGSACVPSDCADVPGAARFCSPALLD